MSDCNVFSLKNRHWFGVAIMLIYTGCTPRVEVVPSKEPITINLNVKIDHEVRVRVDKDLEQVLSPKSELF